MNISELAKIAGVSPSAVSRYLNEGYLSEEKRQAIKKAIEDTGYRPLVQAQALRTRRTKTVGVILPKIDSFSVSSVMAGIDSALGNAGFQILLADTRNDPAKELAYLELFDDQRVDGVILLATVLTSRHRAALKNSKIPVVLVGQQMPGVPCVFHDDYHAFYDLTTYVIGKGRRSYGFIGALTQDVAVGQERSRAWCDALRDAGLGDQEQHTVIADFSMASGFEKARELWERWDPLEALICATDTIAVGALQYLKGRNIAVPEQVLLAGQGASGVSEVVTPAITTIRYYYEESGTAAASLLLERLEHPETPAKEIKLGYTIVKRESTAECSEH